MALIRRLEANYQQFETGFLGHAYLAPIAGIDSDPIMDRLMLEQGDPAFHETVVLKTRRQLGEQSAAAFSCKLRTESSLFDVARAWARAQGVYAKHFGGDAEKSAYNLFTQNQWYVGKLVGSGKLPGLRRLIDNQQEFIRAFEEIIRRPNEQEAVLRDMAVRCLAPGAI